ncbi:MAG TPA: hypothetical protein VHR41_08150 [Gemmatimonadales bacterium]|jgi:hypothetical protein|nr:hypothetical protein [Gemmatimonadales bacterium]
MRAVLWLVLTLALTSCGSAASDPPSDADLRVLFLGNSLTQFNDLPGLVAGIAEAADGPRVTTESVDFGGASLEDLWNQGDALAAIDRGGWDIVVLQQGPSALPESRVLLLRDAGRFAERIRAAGGRPALYMVWPPLDRSGDWDAVTESYTAAARSVDGLLLPAGEAIREALRRKPTLELLAADHFHPTPTGSYLAALVIYAGLSGRSVTGLVQRTAPSTIPLSDLALLEAAASWAILNHSTP